MEIDMRNTAAQSCISNVVLMAAFLSLLLVNTHCADADTKIHDIRLGVTGERTRLVFDASGDHPSRILPPFKDAVVVEFRHPISESPVRKPQFKKSRVIGEISFNQSDSGTQVIIELRDPRTSLKHAILSGRNGQPGHYRLVLDLFPGAGTEENPESVKSDSGVRQKASPPVKNDNDGVSTALAHPRTEKTQGEGRSGAGEMESIPEMKTGSRPDPAMAEALYNEADAYFEAHQQETVRHASHILDLYLNALKADPRSSRAPGAFYRSGLIYADIGNLKKAEKYLQQVISVGPEHPLSAKCWLKLGEIYHQRESYVEAIEAFRFALRGRLEKEDRLEAYYCLGRDLNVVGAGKEAMEALQQCFAEDPTYYLKKPDLLKYLGESYFSLKQFDKSMDLLFRYLNLAWEAPDRDLVLAKIAEIFLNQGEQKLAGKVYTHIQRHYPDSEGDIISKIRNAEMLEKREDGIEGPALAIYRELARKELSPALRRLVYFKLASREWKCGDYSKSMALIEEILGEKKDATSHEEFIALREKVLQDWVNRSASEKDNLRLIELHEKYATAFRNHQTPDAEALIADAYAAMHLYSNAAEIYERLLSNSKKRNEEWMLKLALYSFLLGKTDKAIQLCNQIQSPSSEARKTELLGRICAQQKKYGDAVKHFAKVIPKDKDIGVVTFDSLLAYVESLMGLSRLDEALQFLSKVQEGIGKNSSDKMFPLLLLSSRCHRELKQLYKAIEALERAVELAPSEEQKSGLNYELSRLYLAAGQPDKASQKLSQLLASSQSFWKTAAQQQLDSIRMAKPK